MSIENTSTKEQQLAHMLKTCSEALRVVTAERDAATNAALERAAVVCATEWATTEERKHGRTLAAEIRAMKEEV